MSVRCTNCGGDRNTVSSRYAWQMLFRDSSGGPEIQALRVDVHARAREVLADLIRSLGVAPVPDGEVEPLAELLSMGQAAVALWWLDDPARSRAAIREAIVRVWHGVLTSGDEGRSPRPPT